MAAPIGPAQLSECALKYATAISDPWSPHSDGACIPRHPSRPSQKVRVFSRITGFVGTSGVGGVLVIPNLANDSACMFTTSATFAGTTLVGLQSNTTGVLLAQHNGPYASAQLTAANAQTSAPVTGRLVSVGVSVQYTGTVLNQSGLYYMLCHPSHANLAPSASTALLSGFTETLIKRVTSSKEFLMASSIEDFEAEYYNPQGTPTIALLSQFPYSQGAALNGFDTSYGGTPMVILFTGTPGNSFQIEYVAHVEYTGVNCQTALTPTHGDSVGFEVVTTASAKLPAMRVSHPEKHPSTLMSTALTSVMKSIQPAFGYVGGGIGSAIGGAAGLELGHPLAGANAGKTIGTNLGKDLGRYLRLGN